MAGAVWKDLGCVSYTHGLEIQDRLAGERVGNLRPDTLLLLEHPPTVTLGRRGLVSEVLWSAEELGRRGVEVQRVGRGGGVTYHGPGQLVGYTIVRLGGEGRRVRRLVEGLEGLLIGVARSLGVPGERRPGHAGVWSRGRKLAAIGLEVRRGVARHGFALNVDMDLGPFQGIVPCKLAGLETTDLTREAERPIDRAEAVCAVVEEWQRRFGPLVQEEASPEWQRTGWSRGECS